LVSKNNKNTGKKVYLC